ncbi:hypothetical protein [Nocardioides aurantiacus]|uniref:Uncharacterized protein n=1 Tax=Nocardioides aurantiacus TaxID=86796 RepID=A0A3N2CRH1_9ACTN|nr:hypothetical protein [Nocardioides aurantiacus]ROR90142.1 hypothetical protein EDD33_0977 [Nocardioides aurantiacus]
MPPPPQRRGASTGLKIFVGVLALALVVGALGVVLLVTRVLGDEELPLAGDGPSGGPSSAPQGEAADPPPGEVALLGKTWGSGEDTYTFELDGLQPFRGPDYWGCMQMESSAESARWACTDDGGTFPTEPRHEPPSVGRIESIACPAPCDVSDRGTLAEHAGSFAGLVPRMRALDERTWWIDVPAEGEDGPTPMAMARSYDSDGDDEPDHVLMVFLSAHPEDVEVAGKTMRDLYDRQR